MKPTPRSTTPVVRTALALSCTALLGLASCTRHETQPTEKTTPEKPATPATVEPAAPPPPPQLGDAPRMPGSDQEEPSHDVNSQ